MLYDIILLESSVDNSLTRYFCPLWWPPFPHYLPISQVFFFIDPEFLLDETLVNVHEVTLSYTFFKTGGEDDLELPPELKNFAPPKDLHKPVARGKVVATANEKKDKAAKVEKA